MHHCSSRTRRRGWPGGDALADAGGGWRGTRRGWRARTRAWVWTVVSQRGGGGEGGGGRRVANAFVHIRSLFLEPGGSDAPRIPVSWRAAMPAVFRRLRPLPAALPVPCWLTGLAPALRGRPTRPQRSRRRARCPSSRARPTADTLDPAGPPGSPPTAPSAVNACRRRGALDGRSVSAPRASLSGRAIVRAWAWAWACGSRGSPEAAPCQVGGACGRARARPRLAFESRPIAVLYEGQTEQQRLETVIAQRQGLRLQREPDSDGGHASGAPQSRPWAGSAGSHAALPLDLQRPLIRQDTSHERPKTRHTAGCDRAIRPAAHLCGSLQRVLPCRAQTSKAPCS